MAETGYTVVKFADYDNENASFGVRSAIISDLNFAAQEIEKDAFLAAVDAITVDLMTGVDWGNRDLIALGPASSQAAQREMKWLVQYHDVGTLKRYSIEIPCADVLHLDPEDRGNAFIGDVGVVDAFITAFENYVRSPTGGITVVDEITLVGRNV
jgi:hypothetical protein